jgi:hypothetical protein
MVRVMQEIEVTRPQQGILLAMADHASDDGSSCYPSIDRIAWKAGYKPRAVEAIIRELRKQGILEIVEEARAHRPTEYHIHLEKAPKKQEFEEWREENGKHKGRGAKNAPVHSQVPGVQSHVQKSCENAPEPRTEPSVEPLVSSLAGYAEADETDKQCAKELIKVSNFPRTKILDSLSELREDFPFVDAVRTCKDYRVWCEETPYKRPRSGLRTFFSKAEERTQKNGQQKKVSGEGGVTKDYDWLFNK